MPQIAFREKSTAVQADKSQLSSIIRVIALTDRKLVGTIFHTTLMENLGT